MAYDPRAVSALDRDAFVAAFGGIFEHSPWVAEAAWPQRPWSTVAGLHASMVAAVDAAPRDARLALIRAHPELAGKAAIAGELTDASAREQSGAGLDRLTPAQHARLLAATAAYRERYGFPFVICVREHSADSIIAAAEARTASTPDEEERTALAEIAKIAALRLADLVADDGKDPMPGTRISYGKLAVPVHLVRGDALLACEVSMEVLGRRFLPAYTEGDNSAVVATDTMKNVILRRAHEYDGTTLHGLLHLLGTGFLETYPDMEGLRLSADEQPFLPAGGRVFRRIDGDHGVADLELAGTRGGVELVGAGGGRVGLRLLKTTGSAFTKFARDGDTTLPERLDRPLFMHLDVRWRYGDPADALGDAHVDPADALAFVVEVHDGYVSESIQQLVHEIGRRMLDRWPQLAQVSFRAENHTHDPVPGAADADPLRRTYTAPFPAWGLITLVLHRD
jgi:urate oxidase / 2-oxo-4-hydroxy-4-carboxy-5-ureidoimidazoline decarboxylase